jgi:peptidoglycan/LPS O-acetylase OafA/YrhL
MYFSGYGLSLKQNNSTLIKEQWFKRIKKIYLPLLIVCLCTTLLYAILPEKFSKEELDAFMLSTDIYSLHHISGENIWQIILHSIGWRDWYVCCILLFYSFFYLSQSLNKKIHISQTYLLFIFLVLYYVWAYFYFGPPQAHWYRYCWVFFGGHLHARWKMLEKRERQVSLALFAVLATTALTQGSHMYLSYFIAVFLLIMVMLYNRKYTSEGRVLMFLGGISYFYYLCHLRIGYYTLVYIGSMSIILWLLISTIVAYLLNMLYKTQR